MSNQANSTPFSLKSPTVCLLKPHLGAEGLPFMNKTTLCLFMSARQRSSSCSSVSSAAGTGADGWEVGVAEEDEAVLVCCSSSVNSS